MAGLYIVLVNISWFPKHWRHRGRGLAPTSVGGMLRLIQGFKQLHSPMKQVLGQHRLHTL